MTKTYCKYCEKETTYKFKYVTWGGKHFESGLRESTRCKICTECEWDNKESYEYRNRLTGEWSVNP